MADEFAVDMLMSVGASLVDSAFSGSTVTVILHVDERTPFAQRLAGSNFKTRWPLKSKLALRDPQQIASLLRVVGEDDALATKIDMDLFQFSRRLQRKGGFGEDYTLEALDPYRTVAELGITDGMTLEIQLDVNAVQQKKQQLQQPLTPIGAGGGNFGGNQFQARWASAGGGVTPRTTPGGSPSRGGGGGMNNSTSTLLESKSMSQSIGSNWEKPALPPRTGPPLDPRLQRLLDDAHVRNQQQQQAAQSGGRMSSQSQSDEYDDEDETLSNSRSQPIGSFAEPMATSQQTWASPTTGGGGGGLRNLLNRAQSESQQRAVPAYGGGGGGNNHSFGHQAGSTFQGSSGTSFPRQPGGSGSLPPRLQELLDKAEQRKADAQRGYRQPSPQDSITGDEGSFRSGASPGSSYSPVPVRPGRAGGSGGGGALDPRLQALLDRAEQRNTSGGAGGGFGTSSFPISSGGSDFGDRPAPAGGLDPRLQALLDRAEQRKAGSTAHPPNHYDQYPDDASTDDYRNDGRSGGGGGVAALLRKAKAESRGGGGAARHGDPYRHQRDEFDDVRSLGDDSVISIPERHNSASAFGSVLERARAESAAKKAQSRHGRRSASNDDNGGGGGVAGILARARAENAFYSPPPPSSQSHLFHYGPDDHFNSQRAAQQEPLDPRLQRLLDRAAEPYSDEEDEYDDDQRHDHDLEEEEAMPASSRGSEQHDDDNSSWLAPTNGVKNRRAAPTGGAASGHEDGRARVQHLDAAAIMSIIADAQREAEENGEFDDLMDDAAADADDDAETQATVESELDPTLPAISLVMQTARRSRRRILRDFEKSIIRDEAQMEYDEEGNPIVMLPNVDDYILELDNEDMEMELHELSVHLHAAAKLAAPRRKPLLDNDGEEDIGNAEEEEKTEGEGDVKDGTNTVDDASVMAPPSVQDTEAALGALHANMHLDRLVAVVCRRSKLGKLHRRQIRHEKRFVKGAIRQRKSSSKVPNTVQDTVTCQPVLPHNVDRLLYDETQRFQTTRYGEVLDRHYLPSVMELM